jgi:radical SAM superfamily enzyme YgiQ (UPF0313 family)
MNCLKSGSLGKAWLELVRLTLQSGVSVNDEYRELLAVQVAFPAATARDTVIEQLGDSDMIAEIEKVFFSQSGNSLGHNYAGLMSGPGGRHDLEDVISLLRAEPFTKRAVVTLSGQGNGKVPCINVVQFLIRDEVVHTLYFARGQDAFQKFYADGLCLAKMAWRVADGLGLPAGTVEGFIRLKPYLSPRPAGDRPVPGHGNRAPAGAATKWRPLMRVLFVVPRSFNPKQMYREYALGVGFLGTLLKQAGHEVRVFDQNACKTDDAGLLNLVAEFQPAVVGFSIITPNYPVARNQIRKLKEQHPTIRIIAGGIHATLFPEDLIADGADVVVLGEGEPVILELAACLEEGREPAGLAGLVFRDAAGALVRTPGRCQPVPLDDLPFVDRRLYDLSLYTHHSMLASRGCPHHCSFCCNYTGTVRPEVAVRRREQVLAEMEHLRDAFAARQIFFADDIFLLRKRDILEFCHACAARRLGVEWIGQMRADQVDPAVAEAMREANCQRIYFGVESGSDAILQRARKGITAEQIRRGVGAARAAGMRVKTGWIYGLPGSLEEQYASIPLMLEMRPHEISIHQLIPFPGTIYYSEPGRFGIRLAAPRAFESFCYGGLDGDIQFDYLSQRQLVQLLEDTARALEAEGYVSSDQAGPRAEYVYTTPLCRNSMNVFRSGTPVIASSASSAKPEA